MTDLELVPTEDLIGEITSRHDEAIVIRRNIKDPSLFNISYKTDSLESALDMCITTGHQIMLEVGNQT